MKTHLRASVVIPGRRLGEALCDVVNGSLTAGPLTDERERVTCRDCTAIMHS